jgi:hypothetical protein
MMTRTIIIPLAVAMFAATAAPTSAHHAFVMFDKKKEMTLTGTVKDFENVNPHAMIRVDVAGQGEWIIQTESPLVLEQKGINDSTLSKGEKVSMRVHPMKNGGHEASLIELKTEDGMVMSLGEKAYGELMSKAE